MRELEIFNETGYILSDAAQNRFRENGGNLTDAIAHTRELHQKWLRIFGSEKNYAIQHSVMGTELPKEFGLDRTLISVTEDISNVSTFGNNRFQGVLSKSWLIPQTLPDAGEGEYLIRYGTNQLRKK